MWIFNSALLDFLIIYLPTIVSFLFIKINHDREFFVSILFYILYFIDNGHVYTTNIKTIFSPTEIKRTYKTLLVPLGVVVGMLLWWYAFDWFHFWTFVAYFTVFHNLRQGLVILKWYEKKNNRIMTFTKYFYYLFTFVPILILHFRVVNISVINYYRNDWTWYPNLGHRVEIFSMVFDNIYYFASLVLYSLVILAYIFHEVYFYFKYKKNELNRNLAMLNFAFIYFYSFVLSTYEAELLFMLVLTHGITYVSLIIYRQKQIRAKFLSLQVFAVILLLTIGGILGEFYADNLYDKVTDLVITPSNLTELVMIILYMTPILSHFIWDSYLWKKDHPDSKEMYK